MFIGIPFKGDSRFNKVLFELGNPNVFHSRIRLYLFQNQRLYFEVIDEKYHRIAISADINKWPLLQKHFVHATLDTDSKHLYLIIDDKVVDEIKYKFLNISDDFLKTAKGIIGCSLELSDPCPFTIATHSIGRSHSKEQAKKEYIHIKKYLDSISK
jgi:hypothetical protein